MTEISIELDPEHVRHVGGQTAFQQALGLANAKAINEGMGQLVSQNYSDAVTHRDKKTGKYIITFTVKGQ